MMKGRSADDFEIAAASRPGLARSEMAEGLNLVKKPVCLARFPLHGGIPMNPKISKHENLPGKPISVGLTCWLWQRRAVKIARLGQQLGVKLQITEHVRGLRREIQCKVWGDNVDRFIGEFVRHC